MKLNRKGKLEHQIEFPVSSLKINVWKKDPEINSAG